MDYRYEIGKKVVLKTPENWLDLLRDVDFSKYAKFFECPVLNIGRLRNPINKNGFGMVYKRFNGNSFHGEIVRSFNTSIVKDIGTWIFDFSVTKFPPKNPDFLELESRGVVGIRKAIEEMLPNAIKEGYILDDEFGADVATGGEYSKILVRLHKARTKLHLELLDNYDKNRELWIPEDNLERLVKRFGLAE